jgi:hypothetical protein
MIKQDMLDAYSEDEIVQVRDLTIRVLKRLDESKKAKAIEDARATLAAAGLSFKDVARAKAKPAKGPQYIGGRTYQHPTDKTLLWNAKGQKPKWLRDLEADGVKTLGIPLAK